MEVSNDRPVQGLDAHMGGPPACAVIVVTLIHQGETAPVDGDGGPKAGALEDDVSGDSELDSWAPFSLHRGDLCDMAHLFHDAGEHGPTVAALAGVVRVENLVVNLAGSALALRGPLGLTDVVLWRDADGSSESARPSDCKVL